MFEKDRLLAILEDYKKDFSGSWWENERYKWVAIQHFQEHWDINAQDFLAMFRKAMANTGNLLGAGRFFPRRIMTLLAKNEPETVRSMFINLFDETKDLVERVEQFMAAADELYTRKELHYPHHFQNTNAISVYLWLRYPDKYYIYKYSVNRASAEKLASDYKPKARGSGLDIIEGFEFYDYIRKIISQDEELVRMFRAHIRDDCYPDPQLRTLTMDVGYYLFSISSEVTWLEWNVEPSITASQWRKLLADENIFTPDGLAIVKRMKDIGGEASCSELAEKYGRTANFYNKGSSALAKRVAGALDIQPVNTPLGEKWWPILYMGRHADETESGVFIWKLREGLSEALDDFGLSDGSLEEPVSKSHAPSLYTKEKFLQEVYLNEEAFETLKSLLHKKKNMIIQGPPGVGKTFMAKRLAWALMGEKDESRLEFIQFHQNYSYEDFIMGWRPNEDGGFDLNKGIFYQFCKRATTQENKKFFFIIDEINRGNLSKIFGEVLMLIENDYRQTAATLAYSGDSFSVPGNIYLIGTMNTADRSLAMIDYALRRRFSFFDMAPAFNSRGFRSYQEGLADEILDELITKVKDLNSEISQDPALGSGFCIGHSYFCNQTLCTATWLNEVVEFELLPLLKEYWFDDWNKYLRWQNILRGVLSD